MFNCLYEIILLYWLFDRIIVLLLFRLLVLVFVIGGFVIVECCFALLDVCFLGLDFRFIIHIVIDCLSYFVSILPSKLLFILLILK
jgi:hypothetical protein